MIILIFDNFGLMCWTYKETSNKIGRIFQIFVAFSEYKNFKGQLISKAIYGVLDSPKKRTKKIWLDIVVTSQFFSFFRSFFGEVRKTQFAFEIIWPLACSVLNGHFGPVYLLQVSKNDDEEHCFLK